VHEAEEIRMTTTLSPTTDTITTSTRVPLRRLLAVNLGATVAAGAATEAWVAIARGAGVHLAVGDPFGDPSTPTVPITFGACAVSIAMCMVLGTALASILNWRASRPAYTYVVVAGLLTFVSLGAPLVSAGASGATKLTLIVAHLVAAAVIVPLVARCLAGRR
jgi:Family of unknown function (DUF6069)